jgi:hypothetical protein
MSDPGPGNLLLDGSGAPEARGASQLRCQRTFGLAREVLGTMERTDNSRRASAFASMPRTKKRGSGRPDARLGPAHVRVIGLSLSEADRSYIRSVQRRRKKPIRSETSRRRTRKRKGGAPASGL